MNPIAVDDTTDGLVCPQCRRPLNPQFKCLACEIEFPITGDVPWLFRFSKIAIFQWQSRWKAYESQIQSRLQQIRESQNGKTLLNSTRVRLNLIEKGLQHNVNVLTKILKPVVDFNSGDVTATTVMNEKIPWVQHFDTYFNNIFRDWSADNSGANENELSLKAVLGTTTSKPENLLVLGSGAGRLAYDLHQHLKPKITFSLDINPLLTLIQNKMISGESLQLFELPRPPRQATDAAVLRTLKAPAPVATEHGEFHCILGDAINSPFRNHHFDCLVTPWLVDILPQPFDRTAKQMNRLLKIGGEWRVFGPLSFSTSAFQNDATSFGENEIVESLENCGFDVVEKKQQSLPYLRSGASAQKRNEEVWLFVAKKMRHEKEPAQSQHLPEWVTNQSKPIPTYSFFAEHLGTVRLQTEVIACINGTNSIRDIARLLSAHYKVPEDTAVQSLVNLFSSLIENNLGRFDTV